MLKMSASVAALFAAGLISLACSSSGLKARGSSAGAGTVANGGQAGSGAVGGAGGIAGSGGSGGSGGAVATSGADASAASGSDATACFSLSHACAKDADCCSPNRCVNITGTFTCGREYPAAGGSTATGGNGGTGGTGGASSSGSGGSCYDSSGAIATTAKTCTLTSDCKQVTKPGCCGSQVIGLATSSSCTFPAPPCAPNICIGPVYQQADDGKTTQQGGTIGLKCMSGQCMTFVMAGGVDAATDATGGAMSTGGGAGSGGTQAVGGATGTGGSTSASDGSVSTADLDTCSSDADCTTSCVWTTAPTDSSQCFAQYCCGSNWMSEKRCEANQAAWAVYCPNQSATRIDCPCVTMCDTPAQTITFGCVGGKCEVVCTPPLGGADGSTVIPLGSGGYSGNDGTGGNGGTGGSSNSGGSGGGGTGGSIASGGVLAAGGAIGAGGVAETGGEMGTGGVVSIGGSGVPCTQITNPTTCDAQVGCYALFSGELPCNSTLCSNHFVSCVNAPPECAPATKPCTIDCPLTVGFCPTGYVSVFPNSSGCCSNGCVATNKCN